jgi:hypothetical protein
MNAKAFALQVAVVVVGTLVAGFLISSNRDLKRLVGG